MEFLPGYIYLGILACSVLSASLVCFRKGTPLLFRLFPLFLLLTLVVEITGLILTIRNIPNTPLFNFFTTFEFVFYFLFIRSVVQNERLQKIVLYSICIYPIVALANIFWLQGILLFHTYTYAAGASLNITFSAIALFELTKKEDFRQLKTNPVFWILTGLIFFYIASIPLALAINIAIVLNFSLGEMKVLGILLLGINYIMYGLFIVAFLPRLKVRKP